MVQSEDSVVPNTWGSRSISVPSELRDTGKLGKVSEHLSSYVK